MQDLRFGRTKQGEKAGSFFPPKGSGSPSASLYHPQAGSWTINDRTSSILKEAPVQISFLYSSVQFSRLVVSDSLRPHEPQHARPPHPTPTPGVHPNPCALSQWCHPTISSSVIPFSSCPQSFPASGSFKWVSSSHQVAKVLEFQLQHQSLQWTPRTNLL